MNGNITHNIRTILVVFFPFSPFYTEIPYEFNPPINFFHTKYLKEIWKILIIIIVIIIEGTTSHPPSHVLWFLILPTTIKIFYYFTIQKKKMLLTSHQTYMFLFLFLFQFEFVQERATQQKENGKMNYGNKIGCWCHYIICYIYFLWI